MGPDVVHVPRGWHRTPRPAVLFHGTSTKWLDQILHNGLEPCHMTVTVLMGCYTDDRGIAIHHAVEMAEFEEAGPVMFRLPISCFDVVRFTLDDKFVELHPSARRGVHAAATVGEEASENAPWTWLAMLRIAASVGYTGTIPVGRCDIVQGVAWPAVGATGDSGFCSQTVGSPTGPDLPAVCSLPPEGANERWRR